MSTLVITIDGDDTQAVLQQKYQLETGKPKEQALALSRYFKNLAAGIERANVDVQSASADPEAASGTFTFDTVVATDEAVVDTTTFTGSDTASTNVEFDTSGTDAEAATSLAAKISAHPTIGQIVSASADGAVVTVTARAKGVEGNFIQISSPDATITASGAQLSGGAGGSTDAAVNYNLGIS